MTIKENSWIARIAAWKLHSKKAAIVIGKTIHLHNTSKHEFLEDKRWVQHELCHVHQFQKYGFIGFIARYLWESVLHGYHNNKFEKEAQHGETLK